MYVPLSSPSQVPYMSLSGPYLDLSLTHTHAPLSLGRSLAPLDRYGNAMPSPWAAP